MSNLFTVFVFVALTSTVQGGTVSPYDDAVRAAQTGQWDQFQKFVYDRLGTDGWKTDFSENIIGNIEWTENLFKNFSKYFNKFDDVNPSNVRHLRPPKGGHVYGESEFTYHSATVDDSGVRSETSGGHKIINNDGKVHEYDFKPENIAITPKVDFKDLLKDIEFKDLLKSFKADDFKPALQYNSENMKLIDFNTPSIFGNQEPGMSIRNRFLKPKTERNFKLSSV